MKEERDLRPWYRKVITPKPVLDENGQPMREPSLNVEGFWKKPESPLIILLNQPQRLDRGRYKKAKRT